MGTLSILAMLTIATNSYGLPKNLLHSICYVESSYKTTAYNMDDGIGDSIGLCQIKYKTAEMLGYQYVENLNDPRVNIKYAARYLRHQLDRYDWDIPAAISAYNAGSCRHFDSGQIKNLNYVRKVYKHWKNR